MAVTSVGAGGPSAPPVAFPGGSGPPSLGTGPQPTAAPTKKQDQAGPTAPIAPTSPTAGTTSAATNPAQDAISAWVDSLFEHYLGRPASTTELQTVIDQGWTPDRLTQHLRAQPSYVPGLTIGGYEDLYNVSNNEYMKYLGYQPSDQDIRDLASQGIKDQFAVSNYLKNRPDVVAMHPGAPIDLQDNDYQTWKTQVDQHYQQNLGRTGTDEEARQAYQNRNTPAPAKQEAFSPQLSFSSATGSLEAKDLLSPTARAV